VYAIAAVVPLIWWTMKRPLHFGDTGVYKKGFQLLSGNLSAIPSYLAAEGKDKVSGWVAEVHTAILKKVAEDKKADDVDDVDDDDKVDGADDYDYVSDDTTISSGVHKSHDLKAAKEVARATRGPVASIFYQGLERLENGESLEQVEKSVVSYGGVEMGRLEKNISWISLFIALAPMLGFMGTVVGMVAAFDAIEAAGDIQPSLVAGGIKVALLTTLFGLIVAIILQLFYNYIISMVDDIVNKMEDASISLMDMLVKYNK
jgi:biopolymer transport protein ExbB/TolQ